MKRILFFDTETTGINDPLPVQIALLLMTEAGEEIAALSAIVSPGDAEVSPGALAIHGITTERARGGVTALHAVQTAVDFASRAGLIVAHNLQFDIRAVRGAARVAEFDAAAIINAHGFCTMQAATEVCALPAANGRRGFKWPRLEEAHRILTGEEMQNAHDAMADARACARVYFELKRRGIA